MWNITGIITVAVPRSDWTTEQGSAHSGTIGIALKTAALPLMQIESRLLSLIRQIRRCRYST